MRILSSSLAEYQPIFDILTGAIRLYEAPHPAARWQAWKHDNSMAILEHALGNLAANPNIIILTSISLPSLILGDSKAIIPLLDDYLGATSRLVVRLAGGLDSNCAESVEKTRAVVEDIRQSGVRIAADGFVNGYFNPTILRSLKPDFVYIAHPSGDAIMLAKDAADEVGGEVIVSQSGGVESLSEIRACGVRYVRFVSSADCQACILSQRNFPLP